MKNILVTGAAGFIGSALCSRLASDNKVIGIDITKGPDKFSNITLEQADLTDFNSVDAICEKYYPNVVIHCAGIAHQKIGVVDLATYLRVNSDVTENLAKAASKSNPGVCFIFLSSVSVYGEGEQGAGGREQGANKGDPQITQITRNNSRKKAQKAQKIKNNNGVGEDGECWPSSDYAVSKLDAEMRLIGLADEGIIRNLVILRLAPVYDREWSLNLDRRVFAPGKVAYLRFGSGKQRMSALARPNLVDFIEFISRRWTQINADEKRCLAQRCKGAKGGNISTDNANENNLSNRCNLRMNVCDAEPYEFNRIIEVFRKSGIRPRRPVISVPLFVVWVATRVAGCLLRNKREWVYSCYDKLACDLVFDNGRMMGTGFRPRHSLETILAADERR